MHLARIKFQGSSINARQLSNVVCLTSTASHPSNERGRQGRVTSDEVSPAERGKELECSILHGRHAGRTYVE